MNTASVKARLDTICQIATPEGCEIDLRLAGPLSRARAWLFDAFIRVFVLMLLAQIFAWLGHLGLGLFLLCVFAVEWFYPILFEVLWRGATPGKRMCGLVVLHDDGTPIGWGASFARNTLRFVDFLPFLYAAGVVAMLLNAQQKRLGDLVAGTVVAFQPDSEAPSHISDLIGSEAPPFQLESEEQRAIVEYAQRADKLTRERAEELAFLAEPLTAGLTATAAREKLLGIARFLLGHR